MGYGDLTKLNIPFGDYGGELDPHGAEGLGNPIGGNVTSNRTGSDVNYEEWMVSISFVVAFSSWIDYRLFSLRCSSYVSFLPLLFCSHAQWLCLVLRTILYPRLHQRE